MDPQFSSRRLDHLGLVAGVCHDLDLISTLDEAIGPTRRTVSVGEAVQAMILNGLGFVSRPLYLTPEFFEGKPVDRLIAPHIQPNQLHDDCLGDALDRLFEAGLTQVFFTVSSHVLSQLDVPLVLAHLDSSSLSFHGDFSPDEPEDERAVSITHGYSKDGRPDLKQMLVQLICTAKARLPVWFEALSGHTSDKTSFPETIEAFLDQLDPEGDDAERLSEVLFVADSALYTSSNLERLAHRCRFVTRVPATLSQVKRIVAQAEPEQMEPMAHDARYRSSWHTSSYGGVEQRWLLVHSQPAQQRARATLARQVERESERASKALKRLGRKRFACEQDARAALEELGASWSYHEPGPAEVERHESYSRPGRPAKGDTPEISYSLHAEPQRDEAALERERARKGFFVLATNELRESRLSVESLLEVYKGQNASVERGFRFLKDPMFFAHGLYLQKEERVMAMAMVMTLCLLIYSVAEHRLQQQMREQKVKLPDQRGRLVERLTMRRVFQMFNGIEVLRIKQDEQVRERVLNLKPVHETILKLMGPACQRCYRAPPEERRARAST